MALISSESMTLMVNGTLQSEFLTMFWPMRFTYSVITGSVMNLVLFSISEAYILPILISVSVEYQLPMPRPPISRFPTALTSSMLPALTCFISLPGATTFSGSTAAAATSPFTGEVPGAGSSFDESLESFDFLSFLFGFESVGVGDGGVSPATGVVPGSGCCADGVSAGGVLCVALGVPVCGEGFVDAGVDCPQPAVASARTIPAASAANVALFSPRELLVIASPPVPTPCLRRFARFLRR